MRPRTLTRTRLPKEDLATATPTRVADPSSSPRRIRIVGVVCTWLFVGLVWSLAVPPLEAPDEVAHVDLVRKVVDERSYPRDPVTVDAAQVMARAWIREQLQDRRFTRTVTDRGDRPTFADLTTDATFSLPNQMVQHPPLGYGHLVLMEASIRAALPHAAFDVHLWVLRLAAVLLSGAVPVLIARTVRALGGSEVQQIVAALVPLAIPQLSASMGTIGNDLVLIVAGAGAALAAAKVADHQRGAALRLGIAIGLGALAKGFGLALLVLPVIALLERPRRWRVAISALAVGLTVSGWWWFWNVARYGSVQPHGIPLEQLLGPPIDDGAGPITWLQQAGPLLVDRFWGTFGSFSRGIALPRSITVVASLTLVALVGLGTSRASPAMRRFAIAQIVLFVAAFAILASGAFDLFHTYGELLGVQGRYLFVAVPGLAVVAGTAIGRLWGHSDRSIVLMLAAAGGMQLVALWQVLDGWWGAPGVGLTEGLRAMANWSPVAPKVMLPILAAIFTVGVTGLLFRGRESTADGAASAS